MHDTRRDMSPSGGNVIVIQVWDNARVKDECINHLKFHHVINIALETSDLDLLKVMSGKGSFISPPMKKIRNNYIHAVAQT